LNGLNQENRMSTISTLYYENEEILRQYLEFHYGAEYFAVPNYPRQCARLCLDALQRIHGEDLSGCSALELGCAVGRAAFELANRLGRVMALDLSESFIAKARQLQQTGQLAYHIDRQGELQDARTASLAALGLEAARERVQFAVADACQYEDEHGYDLVFAGNLLDRLHNPAAFLQRLPLLLNPGGLLAISSPYTLRNEFTPRENWLGGFFENGKEVTVLERMRHILETQGFSAFGEPQDVPFVIRETARKFQHSVAQMTLWRYG
jgi:putative 4-mercaptohistidine N1-methyltranferase